MSPAEPGATPAVPQGREEPARAQLEAPARIREEAKVEASTALPSEAAPIALADPTEEELAEFARSVGENSVHGSDAGETAKQEIAFFFRDEEIVG